MKAISAEVISFLHKSFTWSEWQKRWKDCEDLPTALGLVHCVYDTLLDNKNLEKETDERHCFLLRLARPEVCQWMDVEIKRKVLRALEVGFFKPFNRFDGVEWFRSMSPELRDTLIWFFSYDRNEFGQTGELGFVVANFERTFLLHCFKDKHGRRARNFAFRRLAAMGELGSLIPTGQEPIYWSHIDENFLAQLKRLAMKDVDSIEQAILKGSYVASIYLVISTGWVEFQRQQASWNK